MRHRRGRREKKVKWKAGEVSIFMTALKRAHQPAWLAENVENRHHILHQQQCCRVAYRDK